MFAQIITENAVTVYADGRQYQMPKTHPLYPKVLEQFQAEVPDQAAVLRLMNPAAALEEASPEFYLSEGQVYYKGERLAGYAVTKLLELAGAGLNVAPLMNFIRRLQENPSSRVVQDLYRFLEIGELPLLPDGRFLAYKKIKADYTDCHTGSILNTVGQVVQMPRNQVDDDPNRTCSHGLHVASLDYIRDFAGERIVAVAVCPADVVSIPCDYNSTKMRVCRYEVVEELEDLPSQKNHWGTPVVDYDEPAEELAEEQGEEAPAEKPAPKPASISWFEFLFGKRQ